MPVLQLSKELEQVRIIPFEEEYGDVVNNPNFLWKKYQEKMLRVVHKLAYWKNFSKEDLFQQAYVYFVYFCKQYDPYYAGGFIPFDKYLFKNMIIKLRAFIQRFYVKNRREQPVEFAEYTPEHMSSDEQICNDIDDTNEKIYGEYIYSLVSERQQRVLELSINGYKQQEIGRILNISQSRVSVIKKRTLERLQEILENGGVPVKKKLEF